MAFSNSMIDTLTWVLIYGGLAAACLGVFVNRGGSEAFGWTLVGGGAVLTALGAAALWWRSRRPGPG